MRMKHLKIGEHFRFPGHDTEFVAKTAFENGKVVYRDVLDGPIKIGDPESEVVVIPQFEQMTFIDENGQPIPQGVCIKPDHVITDFTISIRSLNGVSTDEITAVLQTKYEVLHNKMIRKTVVAKRI